MFGDLLKENEMNCDKCGKCGKKLQQLLTSFYCSYCEANKNCEENVVSNNNHGDWECIGEVSQIERCTDGYRFIFKKSSITEPLFYLDVKSDSIISDTSVNWFVGESSVDGGWCLYQRYKDGIFHFTCYPYTLNQI